MPITQDRFDQILRVAETLRDDRKHITDLAERTLDDPNFPAAARAALSLIAESGTSPAILELLARERTFTDLTRTRNIRNRNSARRRRSRGESTAYIDFDSELENSAS